MKKLILLLILFIFILGVSCSDNDRKNYTVEVIDGVKVYKNNNKPSLQDLVISPEEIFRIEGIGEGIEGTGREFVWPRFLDIDSKGNIYVVDTASASVKKFTKNGTFIKSFGRKGDGPGEMKTAFIVTILNDVVFVTDPRGRRLVKFDTDGNFIGNLVLKSGAPNYLQAVGKDKFICFMRKFTQTEDGPYSQFNLVLKDAGFQEIATLSQFKRRFDPTDNDFLDRYAHYAVGKNEIFVAENSENHYKINVFDFNGQLLYSIEKNYRKVAFDKIESDELNRTLKATFKKIGRPFYPPIRSKFKKSINSMYYDKEGRLLAASPVKRNRANRYDFLVDVFKDGVFLKKIKLNIAKGYDYVKLHDRKIFFKGGRIYYLNELEAVVQVFEY